jgi:hypothetical protein
VPLAYMGVMRPAKQVYFVDLNVTSTQECAQHRYLCQDASSLTPHPSSNLRQQWCMCHLLHHRYQHLHVSIILRAESAMAHAADNCHHTGSWRVRNQLSNARASLRSRSRTSGARSSAVMFAHARRRQGNLFMLMCLRDTTDIRSSRPGTMHGSTAKAPVPLQTLTMW